MNFCTQFEGLLEIEDGWYDGDGVGQNHYAVEKFKALYAKFCPYEIKNMVSIYPSYDGNIYLEWHDPELSITLEVELEQLTLSILYFETDRHIYTVVQYQHDAIQEILKNIKTHLIR